MKGKWFKAAAVLAVMIMAVSAWADNNWTGAALDGLWGNPGNWSLGVVPAAGAGQGNNFINNQAGGLLITIDSATAAVSDGDIFGPEWGMDLDIDGGSLTQMSPGFVFAPIADAGNHGTINVKNGAYMEVQELLLGDNWWFGGHPYIDLNVYDTSTVKARGWCWLGGHISLYDGTVDIGGNINMDVSAVGYALIDIYDGQLIIHGDGTRDLVSEATIWQTNGQLKAFGGTGNILLDTTTLPGGIIISAEIPEPATLSLLGLGILAMLKKRK